MPVHEISSAPPTSCLPNAALERQVPGWRRGTSCPLPSAGPGRHVLGIDRTPLRSTTPAAAQTSRAAPRGSSSKPATLMNSPSTNQFDALVGRYVLLYQPDPSSTIRSLLRSVKLGGIIVFHEYDFHGPHASYPPCPLFDQVNMLVGEVFRRGGAPAFGRRLGKTFLDAGLPFPTIAAEIIIGGGPGSTRTHGLPTR